MSRKKRTRKPYKTKRGDRSKEPWPKWEPPSYLLMGSHATLVQKDGNEIDLGRMPESAEKPATKEQLITQKVIGRIGPLDIIEMQTGGEEHAKFRQEQIKRIRDLF